LPLPDSHSGRKLPPRGNDCPSCFQNIYLYIFSFQVLYIKELSRCGSFALRASENWEAGQWRALVKGLDKPIQLREKSLPENMCIIKISHMTYIRKIFIPFLALRLFLKSVRKKIVSRIGKQ